MSDTKLTPLPVEQVQQTVQIVLSFLLDDRVSIPASMVDGIVSGKSLLRGLLSGELVVCRPAPPVPVAPPSETAPPEDE